MMCGLGMIDVGLSCQQREKDGSTKVPHLRPADGTPNETPSVKYRLLISRHVKFARIHGVAQAAYAKNRQGPTSEKGEEGNTNEGERNLFRILKPVKGNSYSSETIGLSDLGHGGEGDFRAVGGGEERSELPEALCDELRSVM